MKKTRFAVLPHLGLLSRPRDRPSDNRSYPPASAEPDGQRLPGGNPVLATVDFTIVGHEGARIARRMDPVLGIKVMMPEHVGGGL